MSTTAGAILLIVSFIVLVVIRIPVCYALIGSSIITCLAVDIPLMTIWQRLTVGVQSYSLLAVPFFIMAGEIMMSGGISDRLVEFADIFVGRFVGGMAYVNILASTFFGAVSGSATADISSIGATMIPLMEKQGYDRDYAINVTVTSATQSMIIPPSHNMVIFATAAGSVSVGALFLAGIVPGCLLALTLLIVAGIIAHKRKYPKGGRYTIKEAVLITVKSLPGLMTIVIILLGVCTGLFTATESAAIACVYSFILTFIFYKKPLSEIPNLLLRCAKTLGMVLAIIAAASGFGYCLSYLRVPQLITTVLMSVTDNKYILLFLINMMLLGLGCIMDVAPLIIITTPILLPLIQTIGMNPIQFGIMMLLNLAVGACTPPVGLALFTGCAVGKMPIEKVMKGILPFYLAMFVALMLVTYIPAISLFLPHIMMGISY